MLDISYVEIISYSLFGLICKKISYSLFGLICEKKNMHCIVQEKVIMEILSTSYHTCEGKKDR